MRKLVFGILLITGTVQGAEPVKAQSALWRQGPAFPHMECTRQCIAAHIACDTTAMLRNEALKESAEAVDFNAFCEVFLGATSGTVLDAAWYCRGWCAGIEGHP